jgi:hypothetical protein
MNSVKIREVVIGLAILVLVVSAGLILRRARVGKPQSTPLPTPSITQKVQEKFNGIAIPSDVDKTELTGVSGSEGLGVATRKFTNGEFELTILADLPTPQAGYFYQGWIKKDSDYVSVGKLELAKGGYLLDFSSDTNYSDYNSVIVTSEKVNDKNPETHLLEGSF